MANGRIIGVPNSPTSTIASGIWALNEQLIAKGLGNWPVAAGPAPAGGDPYWANVNIFLDGETVADTSSVAHSITNSGVTASTTQKKFGSKSLYFNGSSYMKVDGTDIGVGTGDFTLDFWVYQTSLPTNGVYVESRTTGATTNAYIFFADSGGGVTNYVDSGFYIFQNDGTLTLNQWQHIAWSRSGTSSRLFIDGTLIDTVSDSVDYSQDGFVIGAVYDGSAAFLNGYIDNLRWTKGVARYTSSFTPPAAGDYGP